MELVSGEKIEELKDETYSYNDLLGLEFKVVLNTDYYTKQGKVWVSRKNDPDFMKKLIDSSQGVKITAIVKPNEEAAATSLGNTGIIGYNKSLTEYIINSINEKEITKEQLANEKINIFTGKEFENVGVSYGVSNGFDYSKISPEQKEAMAHMTQEEISSMISSYSELSEATFDENKIRLGICDLDSPSLINIYPKDFESKDKITAEIERYNEQKRKEGKEEDVIQYTDIVETMMTSVTVIVNIISYVLIAFVSISLIVSSIMIGIITYISVLERIKEIGILRSVGASKKDISRVFNAETFIIGLTAGVIGIGITLLINIPVNIIIKNIAGVSEISALPLAGGIILVFISMVLTMIAGLIPAKVASKKDPVEALRAE